jgi:ribosomal protein L11 methyltransferase
MKPQPLWQLSVQIAPQAQEAVSELLQRLFDRPAVVQTHLPSGRTWAIVFLDAPEQWSAPQRAALQAGLAQIRRAGLDIGPGTVSFRWLPPQDWAESWKRHFRPLTIGPALLIKPSWSRARPRPGQAVVRLDPGISFGTGHHPTTRFCLDQIVAARRPDTVQSFLDIGTGSGILAIAAAKLGFRPVQALDVDPEAVATAQANARQNRVSLRIQCMDLAELSLKPARRYDLVCANLTSNLLIRHAQRIIRQVEPGGRLVLAGILQVEFRQVRRAYEQAHLRLLCTRCGGPWQSVAFSVGT